MKNKQEEKKEDMIARLMEYAGSFRYLTYASWALTALSALMALVPYIYIWLIIRDVMENSTNQVAHYGWMAVWWAVGAMLVYMIGLMCSHMAAFRVASNMRKQLVEHMLRLPLGFFDSIGSGKLRKIVTDATASTETYLAHRLPDAAASYATPLGLLVLLFWFDWRMGLLSLVAVVAAFVILMTFMIGPTLKVEMAKYQNALDRMSNEAVEYIRGMSVVKTFGQSVFSFKRFREAIDDYGTFVTGYTNSLRLPMVAFTVAINSIFAVLMAYAMVVAVGGVSNTFLLNLLYYVIITPVLTLTLYRVMMQSEDKMIVEDALKRIDSVLGAKPLAEGAAAHKPANCDVEFRNVSFRYEGAGSNAVTDVNLKIKQGEKVALVGPSGGGKTTIASLLARFWDVDQGYVTIGGVDVKDMDKKDLMETVSFVFQNSKLQKTSIFENVRMGRKNATRDEVLKALSMAQCDDILAKLPQGIDTVMGSHGTYLSGGEQQRIAIARVMLQDAPVLILDEATAFADPDNEERVQMAFSAMAKGKTVLMIAHRLSTVVNADRICVVKEGQIAEEGTHSELLNKGGIYARMWNEYCKTINYRMK